MQVLTSLLQRVRTHEICKLWGDHCGKGVTYVVCTCCRVDLHCKTATEAESYYAAVEAGKKYE